VKNSAFKSSVVALAMLLPACEGDNPTVAETPPRITRNPNAAQFELFVDVQDPAASAGTLRFGGLLAAGRLVVMDSTVTVGTRRFPPGSLPPPEPGVLQYGSIIQDVEWTATEIEIIPPRVAGVTPPDPVALRLPTVAKLGPDTVLVSQGVRPVLSVAIDRGVPLMFGTWRVVIAPPSGEGLSIWGPGLPPARIPLPEGAFPAGLNEPMTATLDYHASAVSPELLGGRLPDGTYAISIGIGIRLQWILVPAGPS